MLRDQKSILQVSTYLQGYHGIEGLCLGVPAVVRRQGVEEVIDIPLAAGEERQLQESAAKLRRFLAEIGF